MNPPEDPATTGGADEGGRATLTARELDAKVEQLRSSVASFGRELTHLQQQIHQWRSHVTALGRNSSSTESSPADAPLGETTDREHPVVAPEELVPPVAVDSSLELFRAEAHAPPLPHDSPASEESPFLDTDRRQTSRPRRTVSRRQTIVMVALIGSVMTFWGLLITGIPDWGGLISTVGFPGWEPRAAGARAVDILLEPTSYSVTSRPAGATVVLDGETLPDATPIEIDLRHGSPRELHVTLEGYEPLWREISLADYEADPAVLDFVLSPIRAPGRLRARTPYPVLMVARSDRGRVYQAEGRNPSLALPPGRYRVSVTAPEVFFATEVDLTVPEGRDIFLPPLPPAVRVWVTDLPGGALARFDDYPPFPTGWSRSVAVGAHDVEFTWPGGERVQTTVRIEREGQEVSARRPDFAVP